MQDFLNQVFLNNRVLDYLLFLLAVVGSFVVVRIFRCVILRRLENRAERTKTSVDDFVVKGIRGQLLPIVFIVAVYLGTKIMYLSTTLAKVVDFVALALVTILGAAFLSSLAVFIFRKYWEKKKKETDSTMVTKFISGLLKIVIWTIALLLFLDNIGVKVNSIIAGLGIGGVAIAFAAQSVLTDIFCYFTIFFDRPFEIGDFIIAGTQMGTVEHIGVKTTRLRSLGGEELIFSNTDLTSARISNYKTLEKRRVLFQIGVTYDTSMNMLREIPRIVRTVIEKIPGTEFGRAHFFAYDDSSLNFEIVYFVLSGDYDKYMDIHQQVNLGLKEEFDLRKISFAFPTQTLHIESTKFIASPDEKQTAP